MDLLNNVLDLLRPLLSDPCIQIQQCAAIAVGRLVHHDAAIAETIINLGFVPILLNSIGTGNVSIYYKSQFLSYKGMPT